jgi:hypothetical protein
MVAPVTPSMLTTFFQSIHVVECPEFRQLLLFLRPDLQDKNVPGRTKVREAIIAAWQAHFDTLKQELAVSLLKLTSPLSLIISPSVHLERFRLRLIFGPISHAIHSWP